MQEGNIHVSPVSVQALVPSSPAQSDADGGSVPVPDKCAFGGQTSIVSGVEIHPLSKADKVKSSP
jgi:hypothetical protein